MMAQAITVQLAQKSTLITIEFTHKTHPEETQYKLKQPQIVFGDHVTLKNEYPQTEYNVVGIEIVESKTATGKLLFQPYWIFRITNGEVSYWKEESALFRLDPPGGFFRDVPQTPKPTCEYCTYFEDFQKTNGKGWCHCFDHQARTHHQMTQDCILNGSLEQKQQSILKSPKAFPTPEIIDEADLPHSQFRVGNIIKIIDQQEHHSEWGVFEIAQVSHNDHYYDSTEIYLNSSPWLYRLVNTKHEDTYSKSLWVRQNEICHFNESHQICTEEVF